MVAVIRLDRSKPFSECRGDRMSDDPHYNVHFTQATKVGKGYVTLPFDAAGVLVPDDGKTASWEGLNSEGKKIMHQPLYTQAMRDLVAHKLKALAAAKPAAPGSGGGGEPALDGANAETEIEDLPSVDPVDDVDFSAWLRGEAEYAWNLLTVAGKKRYGINWNSKKQMVEDLVFDHKVIAESELAPQYKKLIAAVAA